MTTRTVKQHAVDRLLLLTCKVAECERDDLAQVYLTMGQELQGIEGLSQMGDVLVETAAGLGKRGLFGFRKKGVPDREREKLRKQLHHLADPWVPRDDAFQALYFVWYTSGLWAAYSDFLNVRGNDPAWKALDSQGNNQDFSFRMALSAALLHAAMARVNVQPFFDSQPEGAELARNYQTFLGQVKRRLPADFPPNLELPTASALFGLEAFRPSPAAWEETLGLATLLGACLVDWSNHVQVLALG